MLFVIFINNIYSTVVSSLIKFADASKTLRQVREVEYAFTLHEDFHSMYKWSQNWQLLFNFTKCKCLHIGYNNPNYDYFMGDVRQESIDMEKDLGVHIHKSLKVKEQINYVVKKANRILGTIRRTYTDKSMKNIKHLYITLVRPIIENCQQAWCPHLQKDIDNLESVQRGATKMITGISKLPYYLRLQKCGLLSLQDSRKRADMLEVFTIINRFIDIDTIREYSS